MTIKPSDESPKQGRNRSWQAVPTLNTLKILIDFTGVLHGFFRSTYEWLFAFFGSS